MNNPYIPGKREIIPLEHRANRIRAATHSDQTRLVEALFFEDDPALRKLIALRILHLMGFQSLEDMDVEMTETKLKRIGINIVMFREILEWHLPY